MCWPISVHCFGFVGLVLFEGKGHLNPGGGLVVFWGYLWGKAFHNRCVCGGGRWWKGATNTSSDLTSLNTFSNTFAFFRPKPISLVWLDDIVK